MTMPTALAPLRNPRRRRTPADGVLASAVAALLVIGLLVTYTASYVLADDTMGDGAYYLKRQILWTLIGLAALTFMATVNYRWWQRYSILIMAGTLLLLLALLVMGAERFGGQRWLLAGGSVQPSELAKLAVIIYIADWLAGKGEDVRDVTLGLIPFAILMGLVCGLVILQPDFSTALLIGLVATIMFFAAGADLRQMLIAGAVASAVLVALVVRAPYRWQRVQVFLHPELDPQGAGYQPRLALDAITRGGLLGVGLGQGQYKHALPTPHTDAVFAVLGEELGVISCLVVIALFGVVAWRGLRTAAGVSDPFAALLAVGVTCWITIQAMLNVAVVTKLVPFTGIPLPFISFGGSSLVMSLAATGLLLNLSRQVDPRGARLYADLDLRRRNRRSRLSRDYRARRLGL